MRLTINRTVYAKCGVMGKVTAIEDGIATVKFFSQRKVISIALYNEADGIPVSPTLDSRYHLQGT